VKFEEKLLMRKTERRWNGWTLDIENRPRAEQSSEEAVRDSTGVRPNMVAQERPCGGARYTEPRSMETTALSPGTTSDAKREVNKSVARRLVEEVIGQGRFRLLAELAADDYVGHFNTGDHFGPEGLRVEIASFRAAIPDLTVKIEELLADGDAVVRRFTMTGTHAAPLLGISPSRQKVVLPVIAIDRLADGQLAESWAHVDLGGVSRASVAKGGAEDSPRFELARGTARQGGAD
jgi:predicted ester cyclase